MKCHSQPANGVGKPEFIVRSRVMLSSKVIVSNCGNHDFVSINKDRIHVATNPAAIPLNNILIIFIVL